MDTLHYGSSNTNGISSCTGKLSPLSNNSEIDYINRLAQGLPASAVPGLINNLEGAVKREKKQCKEEKIGGEQKKKTLQKITVLYTK